MPRWWKTVAVTSCGENDQPVGRSLHDNGNLVDLIRFDLVGLLERERCFPGGNGRSDVVAAAGRADVYAKLPLHGAGQELAAALARVTDGTQRERAVLSDRPVPPQFGVGHRGEHNLAAR